MTTMPPIVAPTELAAALSAGGGSSRIIPVSAEWYLPNDSRRGRDEFARQRIPQARFFDLDAVKDEQSPYPHMLPSAAGFARAMDRLRIARTDTVVLYDSPHVGLFSAPRAAWTFQVFGHPRVHVLDNFKLWTELGLPTESGETGEAGETGSGYPVVEPNTGLVVGFGEMVRLAELGPARAGVEIIDGRPGGRFRGTDPEPRPGLSSGHIPGSVSLPFSELLDPTTRALKPAGELRRIFAARGIDSSARTDKILMCGTGVTAAVLGSALELAGIEGSRRVYDGSWTEWAQRVEEKSGLIAKDKQPQQ